jgi:hypothetical protein
MKKMVRALRRNRYNEQEIWWFGVFVVICKYKFEPALMTRAIYIYDSLFMSSLVLPKFMPPLTTYSKQGLNIRHVGKERVLEAAGIFFWNLQSASAHVPVLPVVVNQKVSSIESPGRKASLALNHIRRSFLDSSTRSQTFDFEPNHSSSHDINFVPSRTTPLGSPILRRTSF